jgi:hypothetical protein
VFGLFLFFVYQAIGSAILDIALLPQWAFAAAGVPGINRG